MEEMAAAPPSESSYVAADGPLLYLKGVTVDDAGDYELKATNSEGTTDAKIYLNVQCECCYNEADYIRQGRDFFLEIYGCK